MLTQRQAKIIRSLNQSKYRRLYNQFVVEGTKLVTEALRSDYELLQLIATKDWLEKHQELSLSFEEATEVSEKEMQKMSQLKTSPEVLALIKMPETNHDLAFKGEIVVVLDEIKDPGNLGTIIRTADWYGIQQIICSEHSVEPFNPKVVQASMGAIFRVEVHQTDLKSYLSSADASMPVYGALLEGNNVYQEQLPNKAIIVVGNESRGISKDLLPMIKQPLHIPAIGATESLNAAMATGILLSEFRRSFWQQ